MLFGHFRSILCPWRSKANNLPSRLRCDRVAIVATIANLVCCRRRSQTLFAIELFGTPNRKPRLSSICDRLRLLRDYKGNLEKKAEHWYPSAAKTTHETATGFGRSNCQMNCCRTQICPRNAIATLSAISPLPFHHGVAVPPNFRDLLDFCKTRLLSGLETTTPRHLDPW